MAEFGIEPPSVETDGTFTVVFVPEAGIANKEVPTATELNAGTVKDLTYSLTTSGYNRAITQARKTDERLTLANVLEKPGRVTENLTLQYVHGSEADVADAVIQEGVVGFIVERRAKDIGPFVAGDKVDVIPLEFGVPKPDNPTTNSVWTKTVEVFLRGSVARNVAVVA